MAAKEYHRLHLALGANNIGELLQFPLFRVRKSSDIGLHPQALVLIEISVPIHTAISLCRI
jgi:hypothetical protein